jgi:hypothetical protein
MWGTDPTQLCRTHLLGEHVEMHMFIGSLRKNKNILGYVNTGLVEVDNIVNRHDILAKELVRRGYNHHSPLIFDVSYTGENGKLDINKNKIELKNRCNHCFGDKK